MWTTLPGNGCALAVCTLLTLFSTSPTRSQSWSPTPDQGHSIHVARPSLEQVWSGKGWCGVWCSQNSHAAGLQSRSQTRPWDSWLTVRGGLMHPLYPDKNCFAPKQLPPLLQCDPSLNGGEAGISSRVPGKGSYGQVTALFKLLISHSCSISFQKISITSK